MKKIEQWMDDNPKTVSYLLVTLIAVAMIIAMSWAQSDVPKICK